MAKAPAKKKDEAGAPKSSGIGGLIGVVVATLLAGGAGAFFGLKVLSPETALPSASAAAGKDKPKDGHGDAGHGKGGDGHGDKAADGKKPIEDMRIRPLAPVITNLAGSQSWLRLEAAIVLETDDLKDLNILMGKISEDIAAYMRTVTVAQLEGPTALAYLKDDLNDRARIRSEGKVKEIIVYGLVAE